MITGSNKGKLVLSLRALARNILVAALLAATARAAPQVPTGESPGKAGEIQAALEHAADQVVVIQDRILKAIAQVEEAKAAADIEALNESVDEIDSLVTELALATRSMRIVASPVAVAIDDALREPDPKDAKRALTKLEADLLAKTRKGDSDASNLLGVVRFQLADFLRREAQMDLRSRSPSTSSLSVLNNAAKKFGEALECPDVRVAGIGPSLHAAALRRVVECEVDLYLAFASVSPPNHSALSTHEAAAESAFRRLQRAFPEQDSVDGRRAAAEAREQMDRLRRARK